MTHTNRRPAISAECARTCEDMMLGLRLGIALTFFISGFVSLTFQVSWRKALSQTVGVDFFSTTLVVVIFMLGLALGAAAGKLCLRTMRRPIVGYFAAELFVTLFGLVSIYAIYAVPQISLMMGTGVSLSGYVSDFIANALLLLLPTIAMGVSFPIIVHYFRNIFVPGAAVGFLYSANIFGAAIGALLSGVLLIGTLGLAGTVVLASMLNILQLVYLGYLMASQKDLELSGDAPAADLPAIDVSRPTVLIVAFMIGFVALALEMVYVRMAVMFFSANNYVFPVIVFCYLILLAAGNQIAGYLLEMRTDPRRLLAWAALMCVATIFLSLAIPSALSTLGIPLETFKFTQARYVADGMTGIIGKAIVLSLLMMLPVAFVSAMFPIFVHVITVDKGSLGQNVGTVYFVQTIGNVIGATIAGFILLPVIGTLLTLQLAGVVIVGTALILSWNAARGPMLSASGLAAVAFLITPATMYSNFSSDGLDLTRFSEEVEGVAFKYDRQLVTHINIGAEAAASYFAVDPVRNNLDDTIPLYEAIVGRDPERILIIGMGTGTLPMQMHARYPKAEIVIVELLDVVIREMQERGATSLKELISHSDVYVTDGRRYVERKAIPEGETYDFIQIGVFHVTSSGAGALFTREFQEDLRSILTPDGAISFNAYLPAVRAAFSVFEEGVVYSKELGRQVADAMFFNNDDVDIIRALPRYWSLVQNDRKRLASNENIQIQVPDWYFTTDDPRMFFVRNERMESMLDRVAMQTDNLPATEFFLTQTTTWPLTPSYYSTSVLDPRYWEDVGGFALDGSFGSEDLGDLATSAGLRDHSGSAPVRFSFDRDQGLHGYRISTSPRVVEGAATSWLLEGSHDGINWDELHRVDSLKNWPGDRSPKDGGRIYPNYARVFWFSNDTAYRHYRFKFADGAKGNWLNSISLYEDSVFGHAEMPSQ